MGSLPKTYFSNEPKVEPKHSHLQKVKVPKKLLLLKNIWLQAQSQFRAAELMSTGKRNTEKVRPFQDKRQSMFNWSPSPELGVVLETGVSLGKVTLLKKKKKKKPWEYNEWDLGQEKFMGLTNCPSIMWPEGYQGINLAMPRSHVRLPPFTLGIPMLPSPTLAPIQPVVLTPASSASPALCSKDEISSLLPQKPLLIESADTVAQMTPLASQSLLSRCTWRWH